MIERNLREDKKINKRQRDVETSLVGIYDALFDILSLWI